MKTTIYSIFWITTSCLFVGFGVAQEDEFSNGDTRDPVRIVTRDGFELEAIAESPDGASDDQINMVMVMVHGSGAHSMDVDLSFVTKDKKKNLVFKDISDELVPAGFAVVRYNKRNFQISKAVKENRDFLKSEVVEAFKKNPLKHFVDDVLDAVAYSKQKFPNAKIFLLGHSEGTYVSLQAANQSTDIAGVALIGFAEYSTDTLAFEQTVYRPLYSFMELDKNHDNQLDNTELQFDSPLAKALEKSKALLDFNKDSAISRTEFQAGNFANLLAVDTFGPFRKQEAEYPRVAEILKSAKFKVAFFQGMLDNQTPAYHAMAFELLLKQMGKAENMRFNYFDGLGHALDKRASYQDLEFDTVDADALSKLTKELDSFFGSTVPADK